MVDLSRLLDRRLWKNRYDAILHPRIPEEELDAKLRELRQRLPVPVFWMLGKAQSGKTSIVRALTGADDAEIGNGFQPCTRRARVYDFPDAQTAFLRFLDTRGLGEVDYDPGEDMAWCGSQAHLLLVTMKAMDHQQEAVLDAVRRIHQAHPRWPILVAQTCLHEGYPSHQFDHPSPYAFADGLPPASVPADLARSLARQREYFQGLPVRFVALDFTLREDGYNPADYGLDALWQAVEQAMPLGVAAMLRNCGELRVLQDFTARKAHAHVLAYALSAGLAGGIPLPAASLATVLAIQAKLFHSIAALYGVPLTRQSLSEIGGAVGIGYLVGLGGRELAKLIPVYGQSVGAGVAALYDAAVTYGLGKTFCAYFALTQRGTPFSADSLRKVYLEELERGRELLRGYAGAAQRPDAGTREAP